MRTLTNVALFALGITTACSATPTASNDDGGVTPPPGMAMVRVVHASPDAPAVDVWAKGGKTPLLTNLHYGDASAYLALPAGQYDIQIRAWPSTQSDTVVFEVDGVNVPSGAQISAVAAGLVGSTAAASRFRILPIVETPSNQSSKASVRVVHACADAPTVGIDVNNADPTNPAIAGLAQWASAGPAQLPTGQPLALGIVAGGSTVTSFTTPALEGGDLLVIATGELAVPPFAPASFSLLAVGPHGAIGFIKQDPVVYALHAGADAPEVDAFVGATEIVDALSFGGLSAPIRVQPGDYTIDFFAHTGTHMRPTTKPAASLMTGALAAGQRYLGIATGFLAAQPSFRLLAETENFTLDNSQAHVRAVHASPDAPSVDIGVATSTGVSPVLFSQLTFGNASSDVDVAPGSVTLGVASSTNDSAILYHLPVTLDAGKRLFAVAAGAATKGVKFRLLVVDTSASPWTAASVAAN